jgi:hypothetical protein
MYGVCIQLLRKYRIVPSGMPCATLTRLGSQILSVSFPPWQLKESVGYFRVLAE